MSLLVEMMVMMMAVVVIIIILFALFYVFFLFPWHFDIWIISLWTYHSISHSQLQSHLHSPTPFFSVLFGHFHPIISFIPTLINIVALFDVLIYWWWVLASPCHPFSPIKIKKGHRSHHLPCLIKTKLLLILLTKLWLLDPPCCFALTYKWKRNKLF